jgi:hypothetical protein
VCSLFEIQDFQLLPFDYLKCEIDKGPLKAVSWERAMS